MLNKLEAIDRLRVREGTVLLQQQEFASAELIFDAACKLQGNDFRHWLNLGLALKGQKKWPQARDAFSNARNLSPSNIATDYYSALLWNLGICSTILRDWPYAHLCWDLLGFKVGTLEDGSPAVPLGEAWVSLGELEAIAGQRIDPVRVSTFETVAFRGISIPGGSIIVHDASVIQIAPENQKGKKPLFSILEILPASSSDASIHK